MCECPIETQRLGCDMVELLCHCGEPSAIECGLCRRCADEDMEEGEIALVSRGTYRDRLRELATLRAVVAAADRLREAIVSDLSDPDAAPLHAQMASRVAVQAYDEARAALGEVKE